MKDIWLPPIEYLTVAQAIDEMVKATTGRPAKIVRKFQVIGGKEIEIASHIPVSGFDDDPAIKPEFDALRLALVTGSVSAYTKSEIEQNAEKPTPVDRGFWANEFHGELDLLAGAYRRDGAADPLAFRKIDIRSLIESDISATNSFEEFFWSYQMVALWIATRSQHALNDLSEHEEQYGSSSLSIALVLIAESLPEPLWPNQSKPLTIKRAQGEILEAAISRKIAIRGRANGIGEYREIDPDTILDRHFIDNDRGIVLAPSNVFDRTRDHWHDLRIRRDEVLKVWPALEEGALGQSLAANHGHCIDPIESDPDDYTRPSEASEWFFREGCGPNGEPTEHWPIEACEKSSLTREEIATMIKAQFPHLNRGFSGFARELRAEALKRGFPWKKAREGRHKKVRKK